MIRIITINVNGIRSAYRKGLFDWLKTANADIICMQELKAQQIHLDDPLFSLGGFNAYYHFAEKKGYSGVAIYSKFEAREIKTGLTCNTSKGEGRYVAIDIGGLWVASLYMPSGTTGPERQAIKFQFLDDYSLYLQELIKHPMPHIICGDWNIAHKQIDLKNWRSNQKNSGFLPEERAWMDALFDKIGFVDAFRIVNQEPEQYTWWSNRGRAREKNVGWRIDYQIISPGLKGSVKSASIYKDKFFSDHAPLILDYDISL